MEFVTYFDKNYIPKAAAMIRSLRRQHPDAVIHALCCDSESEAFAAEEGVDVIPLVDLEDLFGSLKEAREDRGWVEYLWTLTPIVMYYLLHDRDEITYVDADLYFYSPLDELYAESADYDISAIPHRWAPEQAERLSVNGKYNVSWLRVHNTTQGIYFLSTWANLCIDLCVNEAGHMGDQGYLDENGDEASVPAESEEE